MHRMALVFFFNSPLEPIHPDTAENVNLIIKKIIITCRLHNSITFKYFLGVTKQLN